MKILVLNPPFLPKFSRPQRSPAVTKSGTLYYPIWLAYCVAVLEADGFEVVFWDAPAAGKSAEDALELVRRESFDLAVLDASTPSVASDAALAGRIKAASPGTFTVMAGSHVSAMPVETLALDQGLDAVARREYEYTIRELARLLRDRKDRGEAAAGPDFMEALSRIAGLSFRGADGVVHNPDRPFIENLDELPWVAPVYKKHLNFRHYFNANAPPPMVTLITSRGCPFRCGFCVYPQTLTGRAFRLRSVDDAVDEAAWCLESFPGLRSIFFEDDTLTANKKRCLEFCDRILSRGLKFAWVANSRADLDAETLRVMKAAGCRMLCVGFESADKNSLAAMHKGVSVESMRRFAALAKKAGILTHGCFIFGFPGETESGILKTIEFALSLPIDTAQFYPVMVYPGTEAYDEYLARGWITADDFSKWLTPEGLHNCVVRNENLSPGQLVRLCDLARRKFYLRPGYVAKKLARALVSPAEMARTARAGGVFVKHLFRGSRV